MSRRRPYLPERKKLKKTHHFWNENPYELRITRRLKEENPGIDPHEIEAAVEQLLNENPGIGF